MGQVTPVRAEYMGGFRTRADAYWTARYRMEAAMGHFIAYKKLAESRGYCMVTSMDRTGRLYKGLDRDNARPISREEWLELDHAYINVVKGGTQEASDALTASLSAVFDD